MKLWWWVEPLYKTGMCCLIPVWIIMVLCWNYTASDIPLYIIGVLLLPLILSSAAVLCWMACNIFLAIWGPYF